MSEMRVECYSGYRADETPLRFTLRGRAVRSARTRWPLVLPAASYFRVRANDGNYYVLRHDEVQDSLDARRFPRRSLGDPLRGEFSRQSRPRLKHVTLRATAFAYSR